MRKRTLIIFIAAVVSAATVTFVNAQSTPTATAVGPWRTGVSVTCPDGRTIPAHTAISGPNVTAADLCGSGSSSTTTSTGGAMISNTGNFKQDMLTNSVNLMIVSKTTNPVVSSFMQGAATGFISAMFANNAEAQRQQQAMNAEILRRQRELQEQQRIAAEQRRIAEQQRVDAMFARLNRELKLEGLPFGLSLKAMNTGEDLQLKGMSSSGPGDLKLKMGNHEGYGIQGLPGIYVGGPAGGAQATTNNGSADNQSAGTESKGYGIQGLPGTYVGGPASGQSGDASGDSPANAAGMPGLPGIYVNGVQPSQAPDLAQAAQTLNGPERTVAQDAALQAAQQNPALNAPSQDPRVGNFQQANQDYQQALQANTSANRDYQTAQAHVEADKSAIDVAQGQLRAITPTVEQQQAFNQMLAAAKTDEDAAALARQGFDSTQVHLSASRDQAAAALAQMGTLQGANSAPSQSASAVDLSHAGQHSTVALLRTSSNSGSPAPAPVLVPVVASHPLVQQTSSIAPSIAPHITPTADIDACLAHATHSLTAPAARPTVEQLHAQLDIAKETLSKLLETHLRENEDREEWSKQMKKGGLDIGYQAFDLTAKMVLGRYLAQSTAEFTQASQNMRRLQGALAAEKNLANQAALEAEIATSIQQRAQAGKAMQLLKQVKEGVEQGGTVRDFRGWLTDNGGSLEKDNPIELSKNGDVVPTLDGLKQIVKITLSQKSVQETLESAAKVNPFVDRVLTAGNTLIDTGYDLSVEYAGFYQLKKADENSELFYRAAKPLQQKIQSTVGQLKCYQ
jgi:hypothetical protein